MCIKFISQFYKDQLNENISTIVFNLSQYNFNTKNILF